MTDIKVLYVEKIAGHPVVPLLARMMTDVGQYDVYDVSLHWEQSAFYVEEDGVVVAALSFSSRQDRSQYFIQTAFVDPAYRRCGYYRAMFEALVELAKSKKVLSIAGIVAWGNAVMQTTAESVGRRPIGITYSLNIGER